MTPEIRPPRVLIIDDLFGRTRLDGRNEERANLCGQFLLKDVTGDEGETKSRQKIKRPVAEAVFLRGQQPTKAAVGDTVENDLEGTLDFIRRGWSDWRVDAPRWSMVLLDLCFYTGLVTAESNRETPGMPEGRTGDSSPTHYFGLKLLEAIHNEFPDLPVVILSSQGRDQVSHRFSTHGALGFLARSEPGSGEALQDYLWRHGLIEDDSGQVIGHSKALLLALRTARRAAVNSRQMHVLLRGERGVGKELFARYIHRQRADRQAGPFVVVNSAILTPELFASELFGIDRRVATQVDQRDGLITKADGGDLFFDEIKDMVAQAQAGILRVLEDATITPVGSRKSISVDVRFLSATNSDIESLAASGKFRSDLLDRLRSGTTLVLPPLRERKEDVPALVEAFVRQAEHSTPSALRRQIDEVALQKLCNYDWPGNVRQLRSCIHQAVSNHPDVEHLVPFHIDLATKDSTKISRTTELNTPIPDAAVEEPTICRIVDSGHAVEGDSIALDELISLISNYEFDSADSAALFDKLGQIEGATARLLANYLKAALAATKRPTQGHPEGEVFIHPAVKLMTGDSKVSASTAADLIKRLLNRSPGAIEPLMANPLLKDAIETALRLRPSNPKGKPSNA